MPGPPSSNFSDSLVSANKLSLMQKGSELVMERIESLVTSGIGNLEKDPAQLDHLAGMLIDHKLNGPSRQVKRLPGIIGNDTSWPETVLDILTRLHHAMWSLSKFENLTEIEQTDLLIFCGVTIRKDVLLENKGDVPFQTCYQLGVHESQEDRLTVRKTYYIDQSGQLATNIEYLFGQKQPRAMTSGVFYDIKAVFYPGSVPNRILVNGMKTSSRSFALEGIGATDLTDLTADLRKKLTVNPWLVSRSYWLNDMRLQQKTEDILVVDKHGHALSVDISEIWYRRLELGARESELHLLVEWQMGRIRVISAYCYQTLFSVA